MRAWEAGAGIGSELTIERRLTAPRRLLLALSLSAACHVAALTMALRWAGGAAANAVGSAATTRIAVAMVERAGPSESKTGVRDALPPRDASPPRDALPSRGASSSRDASPLRDALPSRGASLLRGAPRLAESTRGAQEVPLADDGTRVVAKRRPDVARRPERFRSDATRFTAVTTAARADSAAPGASAAGTPGLGVGVAVTAGAAGAPAPGVVAAGVAGAPGLRMASAGAVPLRGGAADLRLWCRRCPSPEYPVRARRRGWQGTVDIKLELYGDGSVGEVRIGRSSGFASLDEAAVAVARRSRFRVPAGGKVVRGKLRYRFRLERSL